MFHLHFKKISVLLLFLLSASWALAAHYGERFTLVIDAGHGGKDGGALGRFSKEKNINLRVALAFGKLVENNCSDVRVVYTRKTDVFVPLQKRADIANKEQANLFISIHTNSLPKGRIAYGTETYTLGIARAEENLEVAKRENSVITLENNYQQVYQGFDPNKVESYIIFELLQDRNMEQSVEMARCLQQEYVGHAGRRNKGVHQAGFLVLRNTSMPAILTELGFISTPAEEKYLNSSDGVRKLARSLFNGFQSYRKKYDKSFKPLREGDGQKRPLGSDEEKNVNEIDATAKAQTAKEQTSISEEEPAKQAKGGEQSVPVVKAVHETPQVAVAKKKNGRPVFKVQLMVSDHRLKAGDRCLKGIRPVDFYTEKGMYKYTYGESTDYNVIVRKHHEVRKKLKGTFIVAFLNGERMNLAEAIKLSKRK